MIHFSRVARGIGAALTLWSALIQGDGAPQANPLETPVSAQATEADDLPAKLPSKHLPNPIRIHPRVISGGQPEGDAGFKELSQIGVKTIISVDGMTPKVGLADKYGMRYVHLPHGYDGIPEQRIKELAKAVRELAGPIYIHCHHGKHRSPAAATVACVTAGLIPSERAMPVLELAGTKRNYKGLFEVARSAAALDPALLEKLQVDFKEKQGIPPMAEAMVALSHAHDHVKSIAASGWKTPTNHPDLDPTHEALLLRELYTELLRTNEVQQQPEDFRAWLENSEKLAKQLEVELNRWEPTQKETGPPPRLTELANRIEADCRACHLKYRDVPRHNNK